MKKERLILLLGLFVASVFFYLGLNEWLKSKEEKITPPPVVVKPQTPTQEVETPTTTEKQPTEIKEQEEKKKTEERPEKDVIAQRIREEKKKEALEEKSTSEIREEEKKAQKPKEDAIAQKIREEKKIETLKEKPKKIYIVQVGAFSVKENAQKALKKAESLGYRGNIIEEDGLYKVRVKVITSDLREDISKLRSHFGGVILIKRKDA